MHASARFSLSVLMFLQYFTWGAWYVTMGTYLSASIHAGATQIGAAYANLSIAAVISPFFIGLVADRFFSPGKLLGILHLSGAVTLYYVSRVQEFNSFWWLILLYTLLYMPTISLANSISFSQMKDPGKEFPKVRVFGTVGWISAGLLVGFMNIENSAITFYLAAVSSVVMGFFCFSIPDARLLKQENGTYPIRWSDGLALFRNRSFIIFLFTSIAVCVPLSFYYAFTNLFLNDIGLKNASGIMTFGQASEFFVMLSIPFLFNKIGVKKMLIAGIAAWVLRYLLFASGNTGPGLWMLYTGIILHGICYDFFFVTGQIYVDKLAGPSFKNSAQAIITFATYGIGMLAGSYVSGMVTERYALSANGGSGYLWRSVWLVPASIAFVTMIIFTFLFKENRAAAHQNKFI